MDNVEKLVEYCYRKGTGTKYRYFKFVPQGPIWAKKYVEQRFPLEYYCVETLNSSYSYEVYHSIKFDKIFTLSLEEALAYNKGYDELVSDYEPLNKESLIYDNRMVVDVRDKLNKVVIKGVYKDFVNLQISNTACSYEYLLKYYRLVDNDGKIIEGEEGVLGKKIKQLNMDIFGRHFGKWIVLNRYGLPEIDKYAITAFIGSEDCTEQHLEYIFNGE